MVFNDCLLHCGFLSENFYFYGTSFLITVIKKDIILVSRTLNPFIHFYRENINQTVICRITHASKAYYDKLIPGPGGYSNLSWVRMSGPKFQPPLYNQTREDENLQPMSEPFVS